MRRSADRAENLDQPLGGTMKKSVLIASLLALGVAAPATAQELEELNFGIISTESAQALQESFQPFIDDLQGYMGVPVKAFFAPDYAGVIEAMRFDKVDLAWFGNKSAMEAVDRAGGEVFAQTIGADGSEGYYSLLITNVDSPIKSLDDVLACDQSLTFGNGDPNSTSGFLVPSYYVFALNDVDPATCFKSVLNSNHETNALAVANKQVDVATNNTESLYARLAQTQPDEVKQDLLYFFMTYGRFNADPKELQRQRDVLAQMSDGWGPFLMSSNLQLIPIRQLELFSSKVRLQNDAGLGEDEKQQRIAEIDQHLDELAQ